MAWSRVALIEVISASIAELEIVALHATPSDEAVLGAGGDAAGAGAGAAAFGSEAGAAVPEDAVPPGRAPTTTAKTSKKNARSVSSFENSLGRARGLAERPRAGRAVDCPAHQKQGGRIKASGSSQAIRRTIIGTISACAADRPDTPSADHGTDCPIIIGIRGIRHRGARRAGKWVIMDGRRPIERPYGPSDASRIDFHAMTETCQGDRRAFLTGGSAGRSVRRAPCTPEPLDVPNGPSYLIEVSRRAMACDFQVLLNASGHRGAEPSAVTAIEEIERLEAQLTIHRATSEISDVNRRAAREPVVVERRLFALIARAIDLHRRTGGAFDITSGPLSRLWGFTRRAGRMPRGEEMERALDSVGSDRLRIDAERSTVAFESAGMELNLGAIGKGYALDRVAERMRADGVLDFLAHAGQSSVVAVGDRAGESGWSIGLRHPLIPDRRIGTLRLVNEALGTSGAANQYFHHEGKRYGHVIDPRTGWPADRLLSATAIASDAASADALATAFFVMGLDDATEFCRNHAGIGAMLVLAGERSGSLRIVLVDIERQRWTSDPWLGADSDVEIVESGKSLGN